MRCGRVTRVSRSHDAVARPRSRWAPLDVRPITISGASARWRLHFLFGSCAMGLLGACSDPTTESPTASVEDGSSSSVAIVSCEPVGRSEPICGFRNPEDLAPLPGGRALIVSEYGDFEHARPGALALLRIASRERVPLFPGGPDPAPEAPAPADWGDPDCPGPPGARFSPHGIDLVEHRDGTLRLLVVQHGDREAIELFEVEGEDERWTIAWRGCVPAPENASLNDVVGLDDGRFFTTRMTSLEAPVERTLEGAEGDTGWVYGWSPARGYQVVPGTSARMPNGIEASPDGRIVYVNASLGDELRKVEVETGRVMGRAEVSTPDNVTWAPGGRRLVVASFGETRPEDFTACQRLEAGACPLPFRIVEVDPDTLETRVLFDGEGAPMGAGTVGLRVGDALYVGSFAGDRILRVDLR